MNTLDNLKSLDLDSIKPVFDELAGEEKDAGRIGKVDFLFSVYFKSNERESCERLAHELTTRGHRVVAMLNHAKLLLIVTTRGQLRCRVIGQPQIVQQYRADHDYRRRRPTRFPSGVD